MVKSIFYKTSYHKTIQLKNIQIDTFIKHEK